MVAAAAWLDCELVAPESIQLPLLAHAVQRGSLVFDVLDVVDTGSCRGGLAAREHVERFLRSARLMDMPIDHGVEELLAAAGRVVAEVVSPRFVRLCAWWAGETVMVTPASDDVPRVAVLCTSGPPLGVDETSVSVQIAEAVKLPAEVLPPAVKVAAAYTHGALATRRARAAGFDEIVFRDVDGHLAESAVMSLVVVEDGVIRTAPDTTVLDGITRRIVLELATAEGIPVEVAPLDGGLLDRADEAWFSSTSHPLWPIREVDGRPLPAAPGPIGGRLAERLRALVAGDDPLSERWIQPLG
ncbi:MAG: aminotransferase class IV [Actinomycetota bacterium]